MTPPSPFHHKFPRLFWDGKTNQNFPSHHVVEGGLVDRRFVGTGQKLQRSSPTNSGVLDEIVLHSISQPYRKAISLDSVPPRTRTIRRCGSWQSDVNDAVFFYHLIFVCFFFCNFHSLKAVIIFICWYVDPPLKKIVQKCHLRHFTEFQNKYFWLQQF